jgi:hypothetical protein
MRLVGLVEGVEVSFYLTAPNTFTATVPKQLDGTYIIELHLFDDAGNQTNYANVFIKIDFSKMEIQVLPKSYQYTLQDQPDYLHREIKSKYTVNRATKSFIVRELPKLEKLVIT